MLIELTKCPKPIKYAERSQATLVRNRIGDPERARRELGYSATIDLKEGLKRLIDWRANHKAEVERRRRDVGII